MQRASPSPLILSPVSLAVLCLVSLTVLGMVYSAPAQAQAMPVEQSVLPPVPVQAPEASQDLDLPPKFKMTPMLAEKPPEGLGNELPTFVFGDIVSGRPDLETVIDGHAELRRGKTAIKADRIEFYQPDDMVNARAVAKLMVLTSMLGIN